MKVFSKRESEADAIERQIHEDMMLRRQQEQARKADTLLTREMTLRYLGGVGAFASGILIITGYAQINQVIAEAGIIGLSLFMLMYSFGIEMQDQRKGTHMPDYAGLIRTLSFVPLAVLAFVHIEDIARFILPGLDAVYGG